MRFFELDAPDITYLNDADLREMVARLCEAELMRQEVHPSCVLWGGAQEAADGGLDVRIIDAKPLTSQGYIKRSNTGFQVKKNSMSKAACQKEMLDKGSLKGVIKDLISNEGAYIIVSGKDDCTDKMLSERVKGMREVVANYPDSDKILLDFYGVDRLSAWLRQFPGVALWVRSKLGKPLTGWKSFGRWTSTLNEKQDEFLFDEYPCVIDINSRQKEPVSILSGIKLVRDKLRHNGSVVRITGLSGVGKTRFAQALFEDDICDNALSKSNVIYGDLGIDLSPTATELVSYLIANDYTSYLVLDNCHPDIHRTLQKEIASHQAKLSLLTIEYDISEDCPEETEVIHIEPSSEHVVSSLIQKKFPFLGQVNSKRIAEFSGGNARIALALADRVGPDETLASFSDEALFKKLFMQRKQTPDTLLEAAEVLSLVYSFNVSCNEFNNELNVLSSIGSMERNKLIRNVGELLRRKLAQQRGDWRAILPHALANRLARRALQNIDHNTLNNELLKKENFRLFKSCAHRLGYLHDFEPARVLAGTWMKHDGPFYDIAQCSTEQLSVLAHIAPLFPEAVLNALEKASYEEGFCSRENTNFSIIVRLLRKIAYDEQYFDRAAGLILLFAITEKKGEMNNSIVNELSALFSLYLSGTKATAKQRHFFVKRMLYSGDARQVEIAQEIIRSAFKTSNWTSFGGFNFGARSRDYGWFPKTFREMLDWYIGYIKLLEPLLALNNKAIRDGVKSVLENNFLGLWSYVGCYEILESIVHKYAAGGKWPAMWMAIRRTIHYKGGAFTPEYLIRLETLEALAAPSDYYHEIEAYALSNIRDYVEYDGGSEDYVKVNEKINKKIIELGEIAATTPGFIESLAPRLWEKNIDALYPFGKGLAKGAAKPKVMFNKLVGLMKSQKLQNVEPVVFRGFIAGVHDINPVLARFFQETVLTIPELKCHFIDILSATPIASWGAKKLIELAKNEELESWRFERISYGRMHEAISDNDLASLIFAINRMDKGFLTSIEILNMRFHRSNENNYTPNDIVLKAGREAISLLLASHRDIVCLLPTHAIKSVLAMCLSTSTKNKEIREFIDLLCDGMASYRLYAFDLEDVTAYLINNFPEIFIERILKDEDEYDVFVNNFFKRRVHKAYSPLNSVPVERLLKWCNGSESKIIKLLHATSVYVTIDDSTNKYEEHKKIVLSPHVISFLNTVEDKKPVLEYILSEAIPMSWSHSRAAKLEARLLAFCELMDHRDEEVREFVKAKKGVLERKARLYRDEEAKERNHREQTFE